jgi:transcription antitermination factor NusA-like protein
VFDVEASRVFFELFGARLDLFHAVATEGKAIIIVNSQDIGEVIGPQGRNLKLLSERLGMAVRVLGREGFQEMVCALVAPARISGINEVLSADGKTSYRVRIERQDMARLRMTLTDLQNVVSAASDRRVELLLD